MSFPRAEGGLWLRGYIPRSFRRLGLVMLGSIFLLVCLGLLSGLVREKVPPSLHLRKGRGLGQSLPTILKQQHIREAFRGAWSAYKTDAWGEDEHFPLSHSGKNLSKHGGIGFNIVDSMDTMLIMGLEAEYAEAREWTIRLDYNVDVEVNLFETTIRVLGGLLACYDLTGRKDAVLLGKAVDLADRLLGAFSTKSGVPTNSVNLGSRTPVTHGEFSSTSEVATIQMEFRLLSHYTGDPKYAQAVDRVMKVLQKIEPVSGLVPMYIDPATGQYIGETITLGARGDSYYEYLLKQYLQTNRTEPRMLEMYERAAAGVEKHLMARSTPGNLLYIGEQMYEQFVGKMDHLVCFYGASLALSSVHGHPHGQKMSSRVNTRGTEVFRQGEELGETCWEMYARNPTGLAPEIVHFFHESTRRAQKWESDFFIKNADAHSLLRPETVETMFVLWRLGGDEKWRQRGWEMFESLVEYAQQKDLPGKPFTSIENVKNVPPLPRDKVETFFFAETLKYLYLMFSGRDVIPLDQYVLNTEAHPLPIFTP